MQKKLREPNKFGRQTKNQEAERRRKLNIHLEFDKNFDFTFEHDEIYAFFGGPNGTIMCGRRTETDFKDRARGGVP